MDDLYLKYRRTLKVPDGFHVEHTREQITKAMREVQQQHNHPLAEAEARALARLDAQAWLKHQQKVLKPKIEVSAGPIPQTHDYRSFLWAIIALLCLILLASLRSQAQVECINWQNNVGGSVAVYCAPFKVKEGSNITFSKSGSTLTIAASGSVSTGFDSITAATNTGQALVVGNGSTFSATGTGTITATGVAYSGVTSHPAMPANEAGAANNFLSAYNSTTGAWTKAQPTWANIDKTVSSLADLTTRACANLSDGGTLCASSAALPANEAGAANNFLSAYNSTTGAWTKARPTWANIDKTTSSLADLATRACANLSDGGSLCSSSAALAQAITCTGTDKVSAYNATTGAFTCSADSDTTVATSGDSATSFFASGTLEQGIGGTGAGALTCTNQFLTSNGTAYSCVTNTLAGAQHANQGTTTTVLHGNAAGNPSWGAIVAGDLSTGFLDAVGDIDNSLCTGSQVLKKNAGNTAWECAAVATGGTPTFDQVVAGTNANALVVGTGGSLTTSGSGTITATTAAALAANPSACGANNWVTDIAADGTLTCAQPAFSNISSTVGDAQIADGAVDGGTGGEIADGSITSADLATANKTETRCLTLFDPVAGDSGRVQFAVPYAATVTRVTCNVKAATSVAINFNKRVETTPETDGTDILSADLVCDTNAQTSCAAGCDVNTITSAGITSRAPVAMEVNTVTGTPDTLRACVEYTID